MCLRLHNGLQPAYWKGRSFLHLPHFSKSPRAAVRELDELTDPAEKLPKPADTRFRVVVIPRLSTRGQAAQAGRQVLCTAVL